MVMMMVPYDSNMHPSRFILKLNSHCDCVKRVSTQERTNASATREDSYLKNNLGPLLPLFYPKFSSIIVVPSANL